MNDIMTISGIDCYEQDGTAYLKLETAARGLGFTTTQTINGTEYTNVRWGTVYQYLKEIGFLQEVAKDGFIPENVFYGRSAKYRYGAEANHPYDFSYDGWTLGAVKTAAALGWIEDNDGFVPDAMITRGEVVNLINTVLEQYR